MLASLLVSGAIACHINGALPDVRCNPGLADPSKTAAEICASGYTTKSVRPPASYTTALKIKQIKQYGYTDTQTKDYEEDQIISLELGGNPRDPRNLWPEPLHVLLNGKDYGFHVKDKVENDLHAKVCAGKMTLTQAQTMIATDWTKDLSAGSSSASSGK